MASHLPPSPPAPPKVSNVIEPKVFGRSMEMHPVVVLLSLAFWGALWGVMGCLLSIPLTVTMRIVLSHWKASAEREAAHRSAREHTAELEPAR